MTNQYIRWTIYNFQFKFKISSSQSHEAGLATIGETSVFKLLFDLDSAIVIGERDITFSGYPQPVSLTFHGKIWMYSNSFYNTISSM